MSHVPVQQGDIYSIGLLVVRGWNTDTVRQRWPSHGSYSVLDLADCPCEPSVVMVMALYQIKPLQLVNSEGSVVGSRGS